MTFSGTHTAIVTPFRNGQLDLPALEQLVEYQMNGGVDGLVPCGTTGESPTLSFDEYEQIVRTVVRVRNAKAGGGRRVPVTAGAGTNCTQKTIELAKRMADCGADGLLIVAPYYNRPSQEGLYRHFVAVSRAVKLPIMLYNIPGRCGVEVSVETIRRLRETCDNLVAVKHATGKPEGVAEILEACRIEVLSGDDPVTLPMMALGAIGVVSVLSNLAPKSVKRLTRAALDGDWPAAQEAHRRLWSWGKPLLGLDTNPIPIKTSLAMRGLCAEEFRLPMCPLSSGMRAELEKILAGAAIE